MTAADRLHLVTVAARSHLARSPLAVLLAALVAVLSVLLPVTSVSASTSSAPRTRVEARHLDSILVVGSPVGVRAGQRLGDGGVAAAGRVGWLLGGKGSCASTALNAAVLGAGAFDGEDFIVLGLDAERGAEAAKAFEDGSRIPDAFLDATGKVHGPLPNSGDLGEYDSEALATLRDELAQSVQSRIAKTVQLGSDYGHSARIAEEQALIRSIEKHLADR